MHPSSLQSIPTHGHLTPPDSPPLPPQQECVHPTVHGASPGDARPGDGTTESDTGNGASLSSSAGAGGRRRPADLATAGRASPAAAAADEASERNRNILVAFARFLEHAPRLPDGRWACTQDTTPHGFDRRPFMVPTAFLRLRKSVARDAAAEAARRASCRNEAKWFEPPPRPLAEACFCEAGPETCPLVSYDQPPVWIEAGLLWLWLSVHSIASLVVAVLREFRRIERYLGIAYAGSSDRHRCHSINVFRGRGGGGGLPASMLADMARDRAAIARLGAQDASSSRQEGATWVRGHMPVRGKWRSRLTLGDFVATSPRPSPLKPALSLCPEVTSTAVLSPKTPPRTCPPVSRLPPCLLPLSVLESVARKLFSEISSPLPLLPPSIRGRPLFLLLDREPALSPNETPATAQPLSPSRVPGVNGSWYCTSRRPMSWGYANALFAKALAAATPGSLPKYTYACRECHLCHLRHNIWSTERVSEKDRSYQQNRCYFAIGTQAIVRGYLARVANVRHHLPSAEMQCRSSAAAAAATPAAPIAVFSGTPHVLVRCDWHTQLPSESIEEWTAMSCGGFARTPAAKTATIYRTQPGGPREAIFRLACASLAASPTIQCSPPPAEGVPRPHLPEALPVLAPLATLSRPIPPSLAPGPQPLYRLPVWRTAHRRGRRSEQCVQRVSMGLAMDHSLCVPSRPRQSRVSPLVPVPDLLLQSTQPLPARLVPAATVHCPIRTSPFGRQELDADPESPGEKVSAAAPSLLMCTATAARFQSIHAAIAWCAGVSCAVDLGCYAIGLDLARTDWFEGSRNQGMLLVREEIRAHMRPLVVIARDEVIHSRRLSASS